MKEAKMKNFRNYSLIGILATMSVVAAAVSGCAGGSSDTGATSAASGSTSAQAISSTATTSAAAATDSSGAAENSSSASTAASGEASSAAAADEDLSANEVHTNPDDLKKVDVSKEIDDPASQGSSDASEASSTETSSSDVWPDLGTAGPDDYVKDASGNQPHVLVFGDSQFDNDRSNDGLAQKVASFSHCRVYNCAIGGTGASPTQGYTHWYYSDWDSNCFLGMAIAASGQGDAEKICGDHYAYQVLKSCDLTDVDVIVVEYGVNDYFQDSPISGSGTQSYLGAINAGVGLLKSACPNAKIILCNPTYAQFFSNGNYVGDSNMLSNTYGPLVDYALSLDNYAQTHSLDYFNAYQWMNITAANASDYLQDGVHMNHKGRELYAQFLARIILRNLGYSIDEGTDMSTFDFSTLQKTSK